MDSAVGLAGEYLSDDAIHFEQFHANTEFDEAENNEFDVELEGETYHIPADRSIVDVLQENGCDIDTSCEEGICGTCIMEVLEGSPEHRDSVLTTSEKESGELIAVCVSRTKNRLLKLDYY